MLRLCVGAVRSSLFRFSVVLWLLLALTLPVSLSCGGTVLDIGGGKDAGAHNGCVVTACSMDQVWDSLTCSCVTSPSSCQPPSGCPAGDIFDAFQCKCIVEPTHALDAGGPGVDAAANADAGYVCPLPPAPSCCILGPGGCTESSSPATYGGNDHCAYVCEGNGQIYPDGSCPAPCDDAGSADASSTDPCPPGTCRFPNEPSSACLPPGGPISNQLPDGGPALGGCCACGADGFCSGACICASPDTPIATPAGERSIASLVVGDLVYSIDHARKLAVPIREIHRTPVKNHRVVEVVLRDGPTLRISPVHPTADGRVFADLRAGDWLGGREVVSASVVPYGHDATYDILPDSDTGTYFAGGALIGSTLAKPRPRPDRFAPACLEPASQIAR